MVQAPRERAQLKKLGDTGVGLTPRLFRTDGLTELREDVAHAYDPSLAETRRDWATSPWRQRLLEEDTGVADWVLGHPRADQLLGILEGLFSGGRARQS